MVAPFAGAWIEIHEWRATGCRGNVAPFAGAWIEIDASGKLPFCNEVAPFAGAWIEIDPPGPSVKIVLSLPSRERGSKYQTYHKAPAS